MRDWDQHYRDQAGDPGGPSPLVVRAAAILPPGRALDLACGLGRNARYLAEVGWKVTAVDASAVAIEHVRAAAPLVEARVADLELHQFEISPQSWDLICNIYYVQKDLFPSIRSGLKAGGIYAAALHIGHPRFPLQTSELLAAFSGLEILHFAEISPTSEHSRPAVELIVRHT